MWGRTYPLQTQTRENCDSKRSSPSVFTKCLSLGSRESEGRERFRGRQSLGMWSQGAGMKDTGSQTGRESERKDAPLSWPPLRVTDVPDKCLLPQDFPRSLVTASQYHHPREETEKHFYPSSLNSLARPEKRSSMGGPGKQANQTSLANPARL